MLKNVLIVSGLLISSSLCLSAKAATINTSGKKSQQLLLAQLSPVQQHQIRVNNYFIYQAEERKKRENAEIARQQAEIEKERETKLLRNAIPALEKSRDYLKLYEVLALLGEQQKSLIAAEKAVEANPKSALAYTYRGIARSKLNNFKGALADFNQAIEFDRSRQLHYQNRAWLFKKSSDKNGAIKDYFTALRVTKNDPTVSDRRSVYLEIINELISLDVRERDIRLALKESGVYFDF